MAAATVDHEKDNDTHNSHYSQASALRFHVAIAVGSRRWTGCCSHNHGTQRRQNDLFPSGTFSSPGVVNRSVTLWSKSTRRLSSGIEKAYMVLIHVFSLHREPVVNWGSFSLSTIFQISATVLNKVRHCYPLSRTPRLMFWCDCARAWEGWVSNLESGSQGEACTSAAPCARVSYTLFFAAAHTALSNTSHTHLG
jgi:hypothetical protein